MDISIERRTSGAPLAGSADAVIELAVSGRIDAETGEELEHAVAEELRRGHHAIRLDCAGVSFLSSAGIRILFNVHRAAKTAGGLCLIGAASEPVARVLELTRLAPLLRESHGGKGTQPPGGTQPAGTPQAAGQIADLTLPSIPADLRVGRILFIGMESPGNAGLQVEICGAADDVLRGRVSQATSRPVPRHAFGLGLAALAADRPLPAIAGEMLAACGAVFYRSPQPFAAVDYSLAEGNLVPDVQLASGLIWEGLPSGRAGFVPADEEPAVQLDELATAVLEQSKADCVAMVIVAEVHGLVGVELIRPLGEATADDHPQTSDPAVAARWLSFSREPVHARHTALIVGVVTRGMPTGPLAEFVRPLGVNGPMGHAHAAIFPLRPLKRGPVDLTTTVDDLAASTPLAVMHLLGDPQPVLGSGQSELVRGCCWFAPLSVAGASASGEKSEAKQLGGAGQ
jgi:anti-anti-sigma factor